MRQLLVAALVLTCGSATAAEPELKLLVPAYFYPGGETAKEWDRLMLAGPKAVAVVNPDSGPGKRRDANYSAVVKRAAAAKLGLVGYVTLSYAERPASAVKADVDSWLHFYPQVQGIFFDEQPSDKKHAGFAAECFAYARSQFPTGHVLANPGVNCDRAYHDAKGAAALCLFEHKDGFDKWEPAAWASRERTAILVYGVAGAKFADVFAKASKHAAWVYVTDADDGMPWGRLPKNWEAMIGGK